MTKEKRDFLSVLNEMKKEMNVFFKPELIPTGIVPLDLVLNGGLETGSLIELSGESQTGKSTLLLHMSKNLCDKGFSVMYLDVEGSVKDDLVNGIGLAKYKCTEANPDNQFFVVRTSGYQETERIIRDCIVTDKFKVFIIDSVTAFSLDVYQDEEKGRMSTEDRVGADAQALGKFLKQLNVLKTRYNCIFIYINQTRIDLSGWQASYKAGGGQAAKYYPDIRLFMKLKEKLVKKEDVALIGQVDRPYGANTTIEAHKSRLGAGFIPYPLQIQFGRGCSNLTAYASLLPNLTTEVDGTTIPVLEKKSTVTYVLHLPSGDYQTTKGQNGMLQLIVDNYSEIEEIVSTYLKEYYESLKSSHPSEETASDSESVQSISVEETNE